MEEYFSRRDNLKGVVHILDIRREPTEEDILLQKYLSFYSKPHILVATKSDKIPKNRRVTNAHKISAKFGIYPEAQLITFSANTREGKDQLWGTLEALISQ